jgi:glycosyltransferase involved in cell wall biosynthesis
MPDAGLIAKTIESRWGIPFVVTEHSTAFATGKMSLRERRIWGEVASRARRRFAVSAPFARTLEDVLPSRPLSWDVLSNLVDRRFLEAPLPRAGASDFTFVNVGLLEPKKGHAVLLRAFALAFREDRTVRLRIVGDGSQYEILTGLAASLGVADQVDFLGSQSRQGVQEAVAAGNVFVLSSLLETFGVAVVEALALGKPVVVTECGGPESFVQPSDGWIVPVANVDALAAALSTARREASRLQGAEIRERCAARFGESAVSGRLESAYRAVLGEG